MKNWNETPNRAIFYIAVLILIVGLVVSFYLDHLEALEHIKQGHCEELITNSQNKQWVVCK